MQNIFALVVKLCQKLLFPLAKVRVNIISTVIYVVLQPSSNTVRFHKDFVQFYEFCSDIEE
jgi:hypothetical protein